MAGGASISIRMLGDKELERRLDALENAAGKRVVKKAARPAFRPVLATAKRLAPVSKRKPKGRLKKLQLRVLKAGRGRRKAVGVGVFGPKRSKAGIAPDDTYYFPTHVELGHAMRVRTRKVGALGVSLTLRTSRGRVAPRPFLRDALARNKPRVLRSFRVHLWRQIKAECAKR